MQHQKTTKPGVQTAKSPKRPTPTEDQDVIVRLQRQYGNQAVVQMLREGSQPTKMIPQLQRTVGNQVVQGGITAQPSLNHSIQRTIDTDKVEEFKKMLKLSTVTIVEVPNSSAVTLDTKFGSYPTGSTYNAGAIANMSLLDINYGSDAAEMRSNPDDREFLQSKAYDIVDGSGGGGYMHTFNMVMYNAGISDVNRAILHEMGHAKQNEGGANVATANQIILEYHNVLINENRFTDLEEGKDANLRLKYLDANPTSKSKTKSWDDFVTHATGSSNPQKEQNQKLINEILSAMGTDKYKGLGDQVKTNLKNEYFNRL